MIEPERLLRAREAYARGENVMAALRDDQGRNSEEAILVAYDLQSGTYRDAMAAQATRAEVERYASGLARVLNELDFDSMLDVGTGEATTLMTLLTLLRNVPSRVAAFDASWSRIAHARAHAREFDLPEPAWFTGNLFEMPVADGAFDLVVTAHALEPNAGRELAGITALARASRRWVVLFEPSYELGSEATRRRIEQHGYVRGLREAAESLGLSVVRHELIPERVVPVNETAALVLRKPDEGVEPQRWLACPRCRGELRELKGHHFCADEGVVFPVLDGVPCLDPRDAIVASAFAETL